MSLHELRRCRRYAGMPPANMIAFVVFLLFACFSSAEVILSRCYTQTNYTVNSTFKGNLNSVLSSLKTNTAITGYYNTTLGKDPDKVYGVSLCRGDISMDNCSTCMANVTTQIVSICPNNKAASVWSDYCQITYSYLNFFGQYDEDNITAEISSTNVTSEYPFRPLLIDLLNKLKDSAVNDTSGKYFANGKVDYNSTNKIYALVQCTRDLSKVDCEDCIASLIGVIPFCCGNKEGGRRFSRTCNFRYEVYPFFYETTSTPQGESGQTTSSKIYIPILAAAIPGAFLVLVVIGFFLWRSHSRKKDDQKKTHPQGDPGHGKTQKIWLDTDVGTMDFTVYDLYTIKDATGDFAQENMLGKGGYGSVYMGVLHDGQRIAVKRLATQSTEREQEFYSEAKLVAKLQHRNLVRLLGCCLEGDEKILVYEYMQNGSLDVILFNQLRRSELDWPTRFKIIVGVARGVLYLHEDSQLRIIHRDLKVANILLDKEFNPKIADFGLAKLCVMDENEGNTFTIAGSRGYMSPEYLFSGIFSVKSDVFSVGVIILETINGQRNLSRTNTGPDNHVTAKAWNLWKNNGSIELVDPSIIETVDTNEVLRCIRIGLLCVQEKEEERPNMSQVVIMLITPTMALPRPQPPAYFFSRSTTGSSFSESTITKEMFTRTTNATSRTDMTTTREVSESAKSTNSDWTVLPR